jgi:hypothetical protein
MGFFDDTPVPEAEPPRPRQHHPWDLPASDFPAVVPAGPLLLAQGEQVAVAVTSLSAYPHGFEIFVGARIRPGDRGGPGHRGPGGRHDLAEARRSFRFGLQLPDGRKVIGDQDGHGPDPESEPAGPILRPYAFGGGPRVMFSRWWAWPLPPAGPLEFVCEWPAFGIAEARAGIDAQLILDAAQHGIRLWRED